VDTIENDDFSSQLRSLRLTLGKNFRPISTEALASLASVPPVAIRAVEAGRRALNDEDRDAINVSLNARWDSEWRRWVCAENPQIQFSRLEYTGYSTRRMTERLSALRNEAPVFKAIDILLNNLEDKEAVLVLCKLHRKIYELAVLNNVSPKSLERIQSLFPIPQPKPVELPAKHKATIVSALADVEEPAAPAQKNRKGKR
jgi:hypothetical protein